MSRTYLVTGGAGFLGAHLARTARDRGHEVVVADNLLTGYRENIPEGVRFVYIDLADPEQYHKLRNVRPDVVLHCAGQSSGEISFDAPLSDLGINTVGTIRLARWALERGCSRFVYASSVSVYGNGNNGQPMAETDAPLPLSFYGCSKLASEHYLRMLQLAEGLNPTIFRLFNLYGPGQNLANMRQGMVSIYLSFLLNGKPIVVKGALDRYRDFVYIDDCVRVWLDAVDAPATFGATLNVGTGRATTVQQLLDGLRHAADRPEHPVEEAAGTPGDAHGSVADVTRLRAAVGYVPDTELREGLSRMVGFFAR